MQWYMNMTFRGSATTLTAAERERRIELLRERMHQLDGVRGGGSKGMEDFAQVYGGTQEEMDADERSEVIILSNNSTPTNHGSSSKNEGVANHLPWQNQGINQCNGTKYLYYAAFNGFSNQLIAMRSAMRIAHSSN